MPKTKFKIVPPESKEQLAQLSVTLMTFKCGDCGKEILGDSLVHHAETEHYATSVLVDTTINWGEIARSKKEQKQ